VTNTNTLNRAYKTAVNTDLVGQYLKEIGRIPLLTQMQQIEYARNVQQMISLQNSRQKLATNKGREPTVIEWAVCVGDLSPDELASLIRQGEQAKKRMIESNLRLVVLIAKKYQHCGLELIDLIQEGSLGLQRAVEQFDPTLGYKFSSYAHWWIKQKITRSLTNHSRTIRLPVHLYERLSKIKRQERELTLKLGRSPQVIEISQELGLQENQVRECLSASRSVLSLSLINGKEKDSDLLALLPATQDSPEDLISSDLSRSQVFDLLRKLEPQQKKILMLRFGFYGNEALTLVETANRLNLSRERIRQIQMIALKKLRKITESFDSWDLDSLSLEEGSSSQEIP